MNNGDLRFESHRECQRDPLTTEEDLPVQQSASQPRLVVAAGNASLTTKKESQQSRTR
jgi:hypothetical protein